MSKTVDNLMAAFAGESQANRKYTAYAQQADKEGLGQVAKLFRAAAHAETIHALAHFRHAGKVGKTAENLQDAIGGETHEFTEMYPQMIKDAEAEGNAKMAKWLAQVSQVEACHASLYKKAAENAKAFEGDYYLCPVCGYTHEGPMEAGASCPVCGCKGDKFFTVG